MKCPACNWPLRYKGGENKKDHGCSNPDKKNHCPIWSENICFYPWMSVRENWWFAEQYKLPFKLNNKWYCVCGPEYSYKYFAAGRGIAGVPDFQKPISVFKELSVIRKREYRIVSYLSDLNSWSWAYESVQTLIHEIPYYALPVNDDFSQEFTKLTNKLEKYLNALIVLKE